MGGVACVTCAGCGFVVPRCSEWWVAEKSRVRGVEVAAGSWLAVAWLVASCGCLHARCKVARTQPNAEVRSQCMSGLPTLRPADQALKGRVAASPACHSTTFPEVATALCTCHACAAACPALQIKRYRDEWLVAKEKCSDWDSLSKAVRRGAGWGRGRGRGVTAEPQSNGTGNRQPVESEVSGCNRKQGTTGYLPPNTYRLGLLRWLRPRAASCWESLRREPGTLAER